jgi:hypothetical protein
MQVNRVAPSARVHSLSPTSRKVCVGTSRFRTWSGRAGAAATTTHWSLGAKSRRMEEKMTIYIALFNLTDAGIKAAKDSPRGSTPPRSYWPTWAAR